MAETAFASQFLAQLSNKPVRFTSNHVEDARRYPAGFLYTLPKSQPPLAKRQKLESDDTSGTAKTVKVTFKPLRANAAFPPTTLDVELTTPISSIKADLGKKSNMFPDKLRLMLKHKVLGDAVTIAETVGEGESEVTISVMIMPGAQKPAEEPAEPKAEEKKDVIVGEKRKAEGEEFWGELSEWLKRKVGDDEGGKRLAVFKSAWEKQNS